MRPTASGGGRSAPARMSSPSSRSIGLRRWVPLRPLRPFAQSRSPARPLRAVSFSPAPAFRLYIVCAHSQSSGIHLYMCGRACGGHFCRKVVRQCVCTCTQAEKPLVERVCSHFGGVPPLPPVVPPPRASLAPSAVRPPPRSLRLRSAVRRAGAALGRPRPPSSASPLAAPSSSSFSVLGGSATPAALLGAAAFGLFTTIIDKWTLQK